MKTPHMFVAYGPETYCLKLEERPRFWLRPPIVPRLPAAPPPDAELPWDFLQGNGPT